MTMRTKPARRWFQTGNGLALLALGAVLIVYAAIQYWAFVSAALPWLFVAACPLLHVFMHKGHGGHGARERQVTETGGATGGADRNAGESGAGAP